MRMNQSSTRGARLRRRHQAAPARLLLVGAALYALIAPVDGALSSHWSHFVESIGYHTGLGCTSRIAGDAHGSLRCSHDTVAQTTVALCLYSLARHLHVCSCSCRSMQLRRQTIAVCASPLATQPCGARPRSRVNRRCDRSVGVLVRTCQQTCVYVSS